jgi:hypothetical protein
MKSLVTLKYVVKKDLDESEGSCIESDPTCYLRGEEG